MQKWFLAICLILNAKKCISSRQLARDLRVNKDTAWRMGMKIRRAVSEREQRNSLTGIVEVDETYIGGKPRKGGSNGNSPRGRGTKKTPVVDMIERKGRVKAKVVKKDGLKSKKLKTLIRSNVNIANTTLITDEFKGYLGIRRIMPHKTINHEIWYVDGDAHINNIESFWVKLIKYLFINLLPQNGTFL